MPYLSVSLAEEGSEVTFEPDYVLDRLREVYPGIEVDPRDQLLLRLEKAKAVLSPDVEAERAVIAKMKRDAAVQGPARAFTLMLHNQKIYGVVKRRMFQLSFDLPLSEAAVQELRSMIRSLYPLSENLKIRESYK